MPDITAPILNGISFSTLMDLGVVSKRKNTFSIQTSDESGVEIAGISFEGISPTNSGSSIYFAGERWGGTAVSIYNFEPPTKTTASANAFLTHANIGAYQISHISLRDVYGNTKIYNNTELRSLGFITDLEVTNTSANDKTPPVITGLQISDGAGGKGRQSLTISVDDFDGSGIALAEIVLENSKQFDSPVGDDFIDITPERARFFEPIPDGESKIYRVQITDY